MSCLIWVLRVELESSASTASTLELPSHLSGTALGLSNLSFRLVQIWRLFHQKGLREQTGKSMTTGAGEVAQWLRAPVFGSCYPHSS